MGKKVKEKSSKEKVETKENKVISKKKESGYGTMSMIIMGIVLLKVLVSLSTIYHIYNVLIKVPDMPKVDVDVFWGSNVTDARDTSIRPYRIAFTEAMEAELRALFEDYRRMNRKFKSFEDTAWTYGIHSEAFAQFFANWLFKYNYRDRVRFLNKFEHFKTNIQGLDIHFMRVKPKVTNNVKVLPLLILHGWPGSIREFYEAIPLLTTPRPGYDFVFEVIAPSLPGFIYSEAATRPGLNSYEIAIIMRNLMQRLGFKQYYIQGGDFGHMVASHLATIFPKEVLGFHTNFPANFAPLPHLMWILGAIWPTFMASGIADRMYPLTDKVEFYLEEAGYMHLQVTKPDTIGIILQDSPVGLAAYILDKFMIFTDPENKFRPEGGLDKYFDLNKLTDNIMLYWATGSITTSMRLYKESFKSSELEKILGRIPTPVPTWALRFKHELIQHPDFVLRWKYPNLLGSTNVEHGGHFAAFERPEEFTDDVFRAVKLFLDFHK